jgi:DNA-binding GntR family transcriptional regulator
MIGAVSERFTTQNLSAVARERLLRLIAQGALAPGTRINEVHVAERFGISRGPLREAARALEGEGVLTSRPRQGFFVVQFTQSQIVDVYESKRWLEAAFIADIATHMEPTVRREVQADIESIDGADRFAFSETLLQFRMRLCARTHNRFLADLMLTLYRRFYIIGSVVAVGRSHGRQERILSVLRRFWQAMVDDEITAARAIMEEDTAYWLADLPPRFPETLMW